MTSQSPRIYTYKITFEEVPYYYYGMHEEKVYDEKYWGSPYTNKWCWELYTPKKQILETFSSREDASKIERRLIKPFYNTDKWCLNANCGGFFSLDTCSKAGKIGGRKTKNLGVGVFAITPEQRKENNRHAGKLGGIKTKELGVGVHGLTEKEMSENGRKGGKIGGNKTYELGVGIHGRSKEKMSEDGKKSGKIGGIKTYELSVGVHGRNEKQRIDDAKKGGLIGGELAYKMKVGIHARTKEQMSEDGKMGGSISGKKNYENGIGLASITKEKRKEIVAKTNSQKWMCLETDYITTSGPLTTYQRKRGIETSKRVRIS